MRRFSCIGVGWLAGPGQRDVFATHLAGQRTPCRRAADRRWLCSSLGGAVRRVSTQWLIGQQLRFWDSPCSFSCHELGRLAIVVVVNDFRWLWGRWATSRRPGRRMVFGRGGRSGQWMCCSLQSVMCALAWWSGWGVILISHVVHALLRLEQ